MIRLFFTEMVLRNDSEDEREHLLDNNEDNISEDSMSSISSFYSYKNIVVGEPKLQIWNRVELVNLLFPGVVLSLLSGVLFTANNFVINQFGIIVSDAVIVRCVIQISIYTIIILVNNDKLLPENSKKRLLTVTQGMVKIILNPK